MRRFTSHPTLAITTLADGGELTRMRVPRDWDTRYCQEPDCPQTQPVTSVYSVQPKGEGFIGWRAACGRKHALSVWSRDLGVTVTVTLGNAR